MGCTACCTRGYREEPHTPGNAGRALLPSSNARTILHKAALDAMQSSADDFKRTYMFDFKRLRRIKSRPKDTAITSIPLTERNIEFHNDRVEEEDAGYSLQRTRKVQVSEWLRLLP